MDKKVLFIFLGMFLLIGIMGNVNATIYNYTADHGKNINNPDGVYTYKYGMVGNFSVPVSIINITKASGSTANKTYIQTNYTGVILGSATFVGDVATFSPAIQLNASQDYYFLIDKDGASHDFFNLNEGAGMLPIVDGYFTWASSKAGGGFETNNIKGIELIGYSYDNLGAYITTLISPNNGVVSSLSTQSFSANFNITEPNTENYTWKNATYYVWYENGTLFNSTSVILPESNLTTYTLNISGFGVGNYLWNINSYYGNITYDNSIWSSNENFSLIVGASLSSLTYRNSTFETSAESFSAIFNILPSSEISLAQLVYNGTNYTITNLTNNGGNLTIQKTIDIPVNVNPLANETKTFKFRFTYGGGSVQETDEYSQNVSFINLVQCGGSYTTQSINFTLYNEVNQTKINGTLNPINFESNWNYWLGSGNIYKNYSFQNLTSSLNNYQFCMFPYLPNNYTFKTNTEVKFSAIDFRENSYYLRNATLDNVSENILLYLVHSDYATKFFLTFQYGNTLLKNAYVTVQKYFTGLGGYNTVAILTTDNDGQTTMWQEVDKDYKYSIVQDGSLIGIIERTSICSVAPCSMNLILYGSIGSGFDAFYDIYAQNILSNLSYNPSTKIVTYSFIDTTGLANYFRMEVKKTKIDDSPSLICNEISYSSAGTLNCNMTGYDGDFIVNTYISRSPEKVDKIIAFVISEDLIASLGLNGVLIILILIVTLVIAAAVMSRGNPSVVIFVFGFALLGLRIIGILPFSWITVGALEVLIIWIMIKLKT